MGCRFVSCRKMMLLVKVWARLLRTTVPLLHPTMIAVLWNCLSYGNVRVSIVVPLRSARATGVLPVRVELLG